MYFLHDHLYTRQPNDTIFFTNFDKMIPFKQEVEQIYSLNFTGTPLAEENKKYTFILTGGKVMKTFLYLSVAVALIIPNFCNADSLVCHNTLTDSKIKYPSEVAQVFSPNEIMLSCLKYKSMSTVRLSETEFTIKPETRVGDEGALLVTPSEIGYFGDVKLVTCEDTSKENNYAARESTIVPASSNNLPDEFVSSCFKLAKLELYPSED